MNDSRVTIYHNTKMQQFVSWIMTISIVYSSAQHETLDLFFNLLINLDLV